MNSLIYVSIAEYLPLDTLSTFISIIETDSDAQDVKTYMEIRYKASARIITRFMRRVTGISSVIQTADELYVHRFFDQMEISDFYKKITLRMYFLKYPKNFVRSWYMDFDPPNWKNDILSQYQRKEVDSSTNVSRWDLWQLQSQMTVDEISAIGW